jgi:hypothetical protein
MDTGSRAWSSNLMAARMRILQPPHCIGRPLHEYMMHRCRRCRNKTTCPPTVLLLQIFAAGGKKLSGCVGHSPNGVVCTAPQTPRASQPTVMPPTWLLWHNSQQHLNKHPPSVIHIIAAAAQQAWSHWRLVLIILHAWTIHELQHYTAC